MAPREIWCNEAQERYVLAIRAEDRDRFAAICERERCPFAVVGTATARERLVVDDPAVRQRPVDMALDVLLGKPPKMTRDVAHVARALRPLDLSGVTVARRRATRAAASRGRGQDVSGHDRRSHRRRAVRARPDGRPVAGAGGRCRGDADGLRRLRAARRWRMGERTPLALIDAPAPGGWRWPRRSPTSPRAGIARLADVKLSANWMAAAGHPGEDAALFDTVRAVAMELCPALGIAFPSARTRCRCARRGATAARDKAVTAPLSLIVSAFAPVDDARRALTPQLRQRWRRHGAVLIDLGAGKQRLGGSALAQVYGQLGDTRPTSTIRAAASRSSPRSRRCRARACCSRITTSPTAGSSRRCARWRSRRAAGSTSRSTASTATRSRRCSPRSSARSSGRARASASP